MVKIPGLESSFYASWFLETCAFCAVDCYGLISGYVGLCGKHHLARLVELWLQVLFYSVSITLVYSFFNPEICNWDNIVRAIFPISQRTYWYFSSYVGLFFVMPYINYLVNAMSEQEVKKMSIVLFLIFSCGSTISSAIGSDFLQLSGGYSFVWLCTLYLLGASIRKCNIRRWKRKNYFFSYLGLVVVSWGFKIIIENITLEIFGQEKYGQMLIEYTSPTILLCAICLFLIFKNLELRSGWLYKLITFASPLAFSVYLIHTNPLLWDRTFKGAFSQYSSLSWPLILVSVPAIALGIYIICTLIDVVRKKIFEIIRVRRVSEWIAENVESVVQRIIDKVDVDLKS